MSRINPADRSELSKEIQTLMDQSETMMGFVPNDALIMAKNPELLQSVSQLINTIYSFRSISEEIRSLVIDGQSSIGLSLLHCSHKQ